MGRDQEWPSLVGTKPATVISRVDMQPLGKLIKYSDIELCPIESLVATVAFP